MAGFALETGGPGVVLNGSCSGGGIVVSGNVSSIMTFNACSLAFLVYFVCLRFGCCVGCVGWVDRLRCRGLLLIRGSCRLCPWSGAARLGFGLVRSGSGCRFLVLGAPVGPLLDLGGGCVRVHLRVDRLRVGCVCGVCGAFTVCVASPPLGTAFLRGWASGSWSESDSVFGSTCLRLFAAPFELVVVSVKGHGPT